MAVSRPRRRKTGEILLTEPFFLANVTAITKTGVLVALIRGVLWGFVRVRPTGEAIPTGEFGSMNVAFSDHPRNSRMKIAFFVVASLFIWPTIAFSQSILRIESAEATIAPQAFVTGPPMIGSTVSFFGGMPDDPLGLLRREQIQKELELTNAQSAVVKELQNDIQRQTSELFQAQAKFGGDAARLMETATKAVRENVTKELELLLEPKQLKRLSQIEVQMKLKHRGAIALIDDKLAKALEIDDEQKKEIEEKQKEKQEELMKKFEELRIQYRDDLIKEVLSEKQLLGLEQLSGDDYKVQAPNIRRFNVQ